MQTVILTGCFGVGSTCWAMCYLHARRTSHTGPRRPGTRSRVGPQRVPGLPQAGCPRLSTPPVTSRARQLRHPPARKGPGLAGRPSPGPPALHPDLWVLAEPGRGVLRHHRAPGAPSGQLRQCGGADCRDPPVLRRLEPALPSLHLDQGRRPDPHQARGQTLQRTTTGREGAASQPNTFGLTRYDKI